MAWDLPRVRNIGISAHIDSGKTTLTERILYYTARIHAIREVRGKDGVGAKMDSMELERERGITIQSAATQVDWHDHHLNIIDTPGHVDFTVEVERCLRVLDGAIMVLCGVAGVQSQTVTVDRQMRRYRVPKLVFVNKLDRAGADPRRVVEQLQAKLKHNAVLMQLPIGLEDAFEGIIDLVTMRALYFDGTNGQDVREEAIPESLAVEAATAREEMLDRVSMFNDGLMEAVLEERETEEQVRDAVRTGTLKQELAPVFIGSAYKNKGVQPLLDAVAAYLPDPTEVTNSAYDLTSDEAPFDVCVDPSLGMLALAFKLEDGRYGQLSYIRIYQGRMRRGDTIYNMDSGKKVRVGRLVRMHADEMADIDVASAGDIVALFGVDCASGDTFTDGDLRATMSPMYVPIPVIEMAIKPLDNRSQDNMSRALQRFTKEDPTFRSWTDEESGQTIIAGMGELHLDVYVERMRREYRCRVELGQPQVAYRESIGGTAEFNYLHKKQSGGSGQYGRVVGRLEPADDGEVFQFEWHVTGGRIPTEYRSAVEKGFRGCLARGRLIGFPVTGVKCVVTDGHAHSVDSSDFAFAAAARGAFRETYPRTKPAILEPVMRVAVEGPGEHRGPMIRTLNQRRGTIVDTTEEQGFARVEADVPLSEMFGYSTALRSATQGTAEFTMEFAKYEPVPASIAAELQAQYTRNGGH